MYVWMKTGHGSRLLDGLQGVLGAKYLSPFKFRLPLIFAPEGGEN